ncbi:thioredoxin domain-containing protein [Chloroflexales bacterium ZM16-3]|nr:thioredoxin domain-containing protein [Chloroflexales bacterium ZM16-3]
MHISHRDEHGNPIYTNHLIDSASPYLVQHAHNPVDWHEWGEAALSKSRSEDKPILVSIGYAACHWCHVMSNESFDDEPTAALQNQLFINIKVDREERPDIDSVYMAAVQAMTGQGGWPLNVFCTPDGTPFYGGTYFPPDAKAARYRMPSWNQVLRSVADAYRNRRDEIAANGRELIDHLAQFDAASATATAAPPLSSLVHAAVDTLNRGFDPVEGGFGSAPKFPQPMTLEFLLRAHLRGQADALPMLELTLRKMARGGMYDQLGGGFHRYSVDAHWLVPHFEKMLYDNALLARLYAEAYQVTQTSFYRTIAQETLAYLSREMLHPEGGFYSTQDADSLPHPQADHAEEGAFFVWTPDEVREILGADAALFCQIFDVTSTGNFEASNILNLPRELAEVARVTGAPAERIAQVITSGKAKLLAARARRPKPFRDEKIIAAWNGMALRALAVASNAFGTDAPAGRLYIETARRCADFILTHLRRPDGRLLRSWKDGRPGPLGFLEDYALMADGLLALHVADGDPRWLRECLGLADAMIDLFWDEDLGGFYDTAADHAALFTRPHDIGDNATPSGNSVAAELLLHLAALTGDEGYRQRAERVLAGAAAMMQRFPTGFGRMLCAADLAASTISELVIVGDPQAADTRALLDVALGSYRPHTVIARLSPGDEETPALTPLLQGREAINGRATAYLCQGFACKLPVHTPEDLSAQLAG